MSEALNVTDKSFKEEVLDSKIPVLVDMWAPWCMPCRFVAPTIDEISEEYKNVVKVVKINVDENLIASQLSISSIPTLLIFKNGKVVDSLVGAVPKKSIISKLDSMLKISQAEA